MLLGLCLVERTKVSTQMQEIIAWLEAMPSKQDLKWHLKKAEKIKQWAIRDLDFTVGDRVKIIKEMNWEKAPGWAPYWEALSPGQTGIVKSIDFNPCSFNNAGAWHANVTLDREWTTSDRGSKLIRYWHGPFKDTPKNYRPPSTYEQETYPKGRKHIFSIWVDDLAKVEDE